MDVAQNALDVAVTNSGEVKQFANSDADIGEAVDYMASSAFRA